MDVAVEIPGIRAGIVGADGVTVAASEAALMREIDATCGELRRKFTVDSLAEHEPIVAVRAMFRRWGLDPSKYRPSAEALLRRVVQGKGLYNVSNVVDLTNLGSIETGWPYGVYNRQAIRGKISLRLGLPGEKYEGIGRRMWHLEGRPVLADAAGPFGSPISDSTRTQVREGVTEVLTVIYAPLSASESAIESAMEKQEQRLRIYAEARETRTALVSG